MRKIFSFLAIALLIAGLSMISVSARAEEDSSDHKYVISNATGETTLATAISTDIIEPGKHRILRFKVTNTASGNTEVVAGIYDASSVGNATVNRLEGEIESNDSDSVEERYIRPLAIANGIVILQGSHTIVMVEFERYRP